MRLQTSALCGSILAIASTLAQAKNITPLAAENSAAVGAENIRKIQSLGNVSEYRLDNGLTLLLIPDKKQHSTTINMVYRVGSRYENEHNNGLAHVLEHQLFSALPTLQDEKDETLSVNRLTKEGVNFQANTHFDYTVYQSKFLASNNLLEKLLKLEAFRMQSINFNSHSSEIRSQHTNEKNIVLNELDMKETEPSFIVRRALHKSAFDDHQYRQLPIGSRASIENVDSKQLDSMYKEFYRPSNAVLIVSGAFDTVECLNWVATYFNKLTNPTSTIKIEKKVEPPQNGARTTDIGIASETNLIGVGYHAPPATHSDFMALRLIDNVIANNRFSPFDLRNEIASTSSFHIEAPITSAPHLHFFQLQGPKNDAQERKLLSAIESFSKKPLTEQELNGARKSLIEEFEKIESSSEQLASELATYTGTSDWRLFYLNKKRISTLTLGQVQTAATTYLTGTNRTIVRTHSTQHVKTIEIPDAPALEIEYQQLQDQAAKEFRHADSETWETLNQKILSFELSNGIRISLLPVSRPNHGIQIATRLNFGTEESLRNQQNHAACAGCYFPNFSIINKKKYHSQVPEYSMSKTVDETHFYFAMETLGQVEDQQHLLDLWSAYVRAPLIDSQAIELNKRTRQNQIVKDVSNPQWVAVNEAERYFDPTGKSSIRHVSSSGAMIEGLKNATYANALAFHRKFFGPQNANIVIVGEFDADKMKQQITELLEDWKPAHRFERIPYQLKSVTPTEKEILVPNSSNSFILGYLPLSINDEANEFPSLLIANWIFGGEGLQNRLALKIRHHEGLSYSIGSILDVKAIDKASRWLIYANFAPQNRRLIKQLIKEELDTFLREGVSADELEAAKKNILAEFKKRELEQHDLINRLLDHRRANRDFAYEIKLVQRIQELDVETVNRHLRQLIIPNDVSYFSAGDFR
ncbi:insulinase family protein [Undibacterium cyanobacteriorum]|uniref:Insulinase family protein n=1 Tax=Undibacterium cyanobacteriorum TaxID=3073561 RepID=A0ABY9RGU1_9BURK|nr:insulinase family protein [Undibacterium sp. 20NA77.5]WMW79860.1 insulinase family protein [Undibacterium sp. 20NA77.5]